jgi:phosphatidylserine/phosphatidylglycerophosphate/cardiolipin synthase-like enzyme
MGLIRAGETCWRAASAGRVGVLLDGEAYFRAVRDAIGRASHSIRLLGWSFDPRTRLTPGEPDPGELGRTLIERARANPALDIRILIWRSALPISATQSGFPHRAKGWFAGTPVRFELDATVPLGACHHQKVVVVDDALAFVGGADFASDRWDTPAHLDDDPLRRGPGPRENAPRHEVMAVVDGSQAAWCGELFRQRWRFAVGGDVHRTPAGAAADLWPSGVPVDFTGGTAAIARTAPAWRGREPVREIGALTLQAIAEAKRLIYVENQYFAWPLAVEALAARLAEPDGPEVVLVCTERSPSYFDRITMDRARSTALWRLTSSDVFGRFHPLAPFTAAGTPIVAHAKVMAVDDRLLRVSSANLNNRSHGFDTECELALEAGSPAEERAIGALRDRLAAHWVGRSGPELADGGGAAGSLGEALRVLGGEGRLRPLASRRLGPIGEFIAEFHIGDPTDAADSWRPLRRRQRLLAEARGLREQLASTLR